MNLAAVGGLPLTPESGTWYRALALKYLPTALTSAHSVRIFSRFSPGPLARPGFQVLYLAETPQVALFEVEALFGSPIKPGGIVANPAGAWAIVNATVKLTQVADLTGTVEQASLGTTAEELTGDWRGYQQRGPATSVSQPVGIAPTQQLGEALSKDLRALEGFRTLSAKIPYHQALAVFPQHLRRGSSVTFEYEDADGQSRRQKITGAI